MIWIASLVHVTALLAGLVLLHKFGDLFQSGTFSLKGLDIVEAIYLTVCGSTLLCPVAIYDIVMTALEKSVITDTTMAYLAGSGFAFTAFHLIGYKTMEQVNNDRVRWRVL